MRIEEAAKGVAAVGGGVFIGLTAVWLFKAWADRYNKQAEHRDLKNALADANMGYKLAKWSV